jgi:hypothetical protein
MRAAAVVAFFAALWFILWRQLSGEWLVNDQYSYGWFVPLFALVLFWLRWEDAPQLRARSEEQGAEENAAQTLSSNLLAPSTKARALSIVIVILALVLLLPIRVFEIGNPDWRPLSWLHAICTVTITLGARGFALSKLGVRPYSRMRRG